MNNLFWRILCIGTPVIAAITITVCLIWPESKTNWSENFAVANNPVSNKRTAIDIGFRSDGVVCWKWGRVIPLSVPALTQSQLDNIISNKWNNSK